MGEARYLRSSARPRANPANIGDLHRRIGKRERRPAVAQRGRHHSWLEKQAGSRRAGSTLAFGVVPDLLDESLVTLDPELDHDVDSRYRRLLMSLRASSRPP